MPKKKTYPGTIEQRGDSFRVILYFEGKRHSHSIQTADRNEAEEFARQKLQEHQRLADRRLAGLPDPKRFSGFLEQYERDRLPHLAPRTRETYRIALAYFRTFFVEMKGDPRVDQIGSGHVAAFLAWRRTQRRHGKAEGTVSGRTVAKDRTVLHSVFAYAVELEMREGNPVGRTRPPKVESRDPVLLTDAEYDRLVGACGENDMLRLYVLTLGETGARAVSEAMRLKWEDVDLDSGFLWIPSRDKEHRTKSGKGRWIPMTPRLRQAMRDHFARYRFTSYSGQRPGYLFHHTRTRRNAKAGDRIRSFRSSFARAVKAAELPAGFRPHDLRHRRATTWLADGKNPVHVKEALGHADLRTTMGYTHLAREHLRSLVDEEPGREKLKDLGG